MKNILVTGGLGFIGSNTCISLLEEGFRIFLIDSLINSSLDIYKNIKELKSTYVKGNTGELDLFEGDIRDEIFLEKVFQYASDNKSSIDMVIHLAGLKSVAESEKYPEKYWEVNYKGTKRLINVMEKFNCYSLVFSSSATIYGINNSILTEKSIINPINTYGKTKLYVEKFLENKYKENPSLWNIINLRYFNPIGGHSSGSLGENIFKEPHNILPILCMVADGEKRFIHIYGNDWETKDGTAIRDYVHIMDIARGHVCAINYLLNKNSGCISINLGTGKGTSVLELIRTFEKVSKRKINYIFSNKRKGDVAQYVASNLMARKLLNWEPIHSIEKMCLDGWIFYLSKKYLKDS